MGEVEIFLELYVSNISESVEMFTTLGEMVVLRSEGDFAELAHGNSRLLLNSQATEHFDESNPFRSMTAETPRGVGVEIGLGVADVQATFERAGKDQRWKMASELQERPWGLTDFRVLHPDGFYLRITST